MIRLEVKNLHTQIKQNKNKINILQDISFQLKDSQTLAIVGESGSGKSMLAYSIMRLLEKPIEISQGKILYYQEKQNIEEEQNKTETIDLLSLSEQQMRAIRGKEIAFIFQEPMTALNPILKIGDQIEEAIHAHQQIDATQSYKETLVLMDKVRIPDAKEKLKCYPHELSGGMRQRIMIAMALASKPKILIADEPTTALDVSVQAQILELLSDLKEQEKLSLILISHDLGIVSQLADLVLVLYAGKVAEFCSAHRFFQKPKHPYSQGLIHSLPTLSQKKNEKLFSIPGQTPSFKDSKLGCLFEPRCFKKVMACGLREPSLRYTGASHWVRCFNG